jgi:hypothetical protein
MKATRGICLAALGALIACAGCSGSGSDGSGSGTLSVSLIDAPVDYVTEVVVVITGLWLKGPNGPAVELPMTSSPMTVDLLTLREGDGALLLDGYQIDAGRYEWLAMDVDAQFDGDYASYAITDTGEMLEIEVPSSRVRLVSSFTVEASEALELVFDWDLRKGLVDVMSQPGLLLKPAFRVIDVKQFGALSGTIMATTILDPINDCNDDDQIGADYDVGNVVYIYNGFDVAPDDMDGADPEPVATVDALANDAGDYVYRILLEPGEYTAASVPQHQRVMQLRPTWTDMITRRCVSTYSSSSLTSPRLM